MSAALSKELREELGRVLAGRPEVARAYFVPGEPTSTLAFEYDESPESIADAQRMASELVKLVVPLLGEAGRRIGFTAGGPDEIALAAPGGEVVYERP
jgi:hypothetical protein